MDKNITEKQAEREVLEDKFSTRFILVGAMLATSLILFSAEAETTAWLIIEKGAGLFLFWLAALIDLRKPTNKNKDYGKENENLHEVR